MNGETPLNPPAQRPAVSGIGCLKWAGIGCITLFLILIAAGVAVIVNRDAILESSWFRSARDQATEIGSEMAALVNLSRELSARYPATSIGTASNVEAGGTRTLRITITNPKFEIDGIEESKAREIARTSLDLYPEVAEYDIIQIVFEREAGSVVSVSSSDPYDISVESLFADETAEPEPSEPEPENPAPEDSTTR
ncbi:MAG: hypothetical protein KY459_14940 [Acidobacteria bacterium]|nr:hypothetical protein [Acidobacteriota bacterium]